MALNTSKRFHQHCAAIRAELEALNRRCAVCDRPIGAKRSDAKTCSSRCRSALSRERTGCHRAAFVEH